jgi:PTS system nitrogen regulatory IIA component
MDKQNVDLLFALLVPEESTEEHLQILAQLAEMFSDESLRNRLRKASSREELHRLLLEGARRNAG